MVDANSLPHPKIYPSSLHIISLSISIFYIAAKNAKSCYFYKGMIFKYKAKLKQYPYFVLPHK